MFLSCHSFYPFIHEESPLVVSMATLNSLTKRLVTSFDFANTPSPSTNTHLHGYFSLLNVGRMKRIILTGDILDVVINTHGILVFAHTTVSMKVRHWIEVILYKEKPIWKIYPG